MDKYKCKICGENHDIVKAIEVPKPEMILEMKDAELKQRVKDIQGSYIIDDDVFHLRGNIFIYKIGTDEPFFNWSVWVSISLADYKSKADELKQRTNVEFNARLETELPFYEKTRDLKVKAFINLNYDYAVIKIEEESQIKNDQSNKISEERVIEIMQMAYHNPKKVNQKIDKK